MTERETDGASTDEAAGTCFVRAAHEAGRLHFAVHAGIAETPTPSLDDVLSRLSRAADYSRRSIASAAVLCPSGPRRTARAELAARTDAVLDGISLRTFGGRIRLRHRGRAGHARGRFSAAWARCACRIFACPHRRPLSGGRCRRSASRQRACAGNDVCAGPVIAVTVTAIPLSELPLPGFAAPAGDRSPSGETLVTW